MVNAAEIVNAFRGPDGLRRFRRWLDAPDEELVQLARRTAGGGKQGGRRKGRQQAGAGPGSPAGASQGGGEQAAGDEEGPGEGSGDSGGEGEQSSEFKRKHRNVRRSWEAPPSFPSAAVEQAYSQPKVDASKDK